METKDRDEEYDREKPNKERFDYGILRCTNKKNVKEMVSKETEYFVEQGEGGRLKKIDVETNEGNDARGN